MIRKTDNGIISGQKPHSALRNGVNPRQSIAGEQGRANPPRGALSDAMNIARLSQSVMQKAMMVSSRLRNIAAEAMTTGTVRDAELSSVLADMNATLDRFGENIASSAGEGVQSAGRSAPEDLARAKDMTASLLKRLAQGEGAQGMIGELSRTAVQAEKAFLSDATNGPVNPESLLRDTSAAISTNPDGALLSQGQVSRIAAERLTGTA